MTGRLAPPGGRDEQIKRTARILEIVQQIAVSPGRWSRKELAAHHELSERMIQKDLEIIRYRLGLTLEHDGQGYYFHRLPHLPTTAYSFGEALSLLLAARTAQALPGVNSADLAAAIARLQSIFPDSLQTVLREATEQLPERAVKTRRQAMLTLLHRAWVEHRQVDIAYATGYREGKVGRRIVEPYHLLPYGRSWHLIAYDHKRQEILQFKVDRINEAALLQRTYQIPVDFDIDAYLGEAWGLMRGSAGEVEEISLLFEPEAGRWVSEEQWHKSQASEELADGRFRISFYAGITPEMVRWLLYYGADVWVEKPLWLREEVQAQHREATARWEKKDD